jgi:hypothetical protein
MIKDENKMKKKSILDIERKIKLLLLIIYLCRIGTIRINYINYRKKANTTTAATNIHSKINSSSFS